MVMDVPDVNVVADAGWLAEADAAVAELLMLMLLLLCHPDAPVLMPPSLLLVGSRCWLSMLRPEAICCEGCPCCRRTLSRCHDGTG